MLAAVVVATLISGGSSSPSGERPLAVRERASEERLQHEVTHDGLTGLANRALFRDRWPRRSAKRVTSPSVLIDLTTSRRFNDARPCGR